MLVETAKNKLKKRKILSAVNSYSFLYGLDYCSATPQLPLPLISLPVHSLQTLQNWAGVTSRILQCLKQLIYFIMPLVGHRIGIQHPFQSLPNLLSCSVELESLKPHPVDILAIRTACAMKNPPSEVPCQMLREGVSEAGPSAAGSVISTVEKLNFSGFFC